MTDVPKSKLLEGITKQLDNENKLENIKTKAEISDNTKSTTAGVTSESSAFDLKKFKGVDNQGRRNLFLDATKFHDQYSEKVNESKIMLDSKVKKLKETMELQKRYYHLVPRPIANDVTNSNTSKRYLFNVNGTNIDANHPEHVFINNYNSTRVGNSLFTYNIVPRNQEVKTDISQFSTNFLTGGDGGKTGVASDIINSVTGFVTEKTDGMIDAGNTSLTVNNLSEEPFIFTRIKPVEANLSLEQSRDKFIENLKKIRIASNYESESEAMREYIKLSDDSSTLVNPDTERDRKNKLMKDLRSTLGTEYTKIIDDFQNKIDNYLSDENIPISISEEDFNISSLYISGFNEPKWGSNKQQSLQNYFKEQSNSLISKNTLLNSQPADLTTIDTIGTDYMRATRALRDSRYSPITYDERYNRSPRYASQFDIINNISGLVGLQKDTQTHTPDWYETTINNIGRAPPFQDDFYVNLIPLLRNVNRNTEKWLKFVSEEKSKLRKNLQEFNTNLREEYDDRSKGILKPTTDDLEKNARNLCKIMLGDLYTLTMYGSISDTKDYFSGYDKYIEKQNEYGNMCEPGPGRKLLCLFPNSIQSNLPDISFGDTDTRAADEADDRKSSNMYICLGTLLDTSIHDSAITGEIGRQGVNFRARKKIYDYKVCKCMFANMIYHRLTDFPGEYKLFPDDIKFLAYISGIVWTPFIDIKALITSIFSNNDTGAHMGIGEDSYTNTQIASRGYSLSIDDKYNKVVIDYYNNIPNVCYEYLSRVIPIFSIDDTCYMPKHEIGSRETTARLLTFIGPTNDQADSIQNGLYYISRRSIDLTSISNYDKMNKGNNSSLPLRPYDNYKRAGTSVNLLKKTFYESIHDVRIPALQLSVETYGIEKLINIKPTYSGRKQSYWTKLEELNDVNNKRENTAFYYIEEKLTTEKLANDYFDNFKQLAEMKATLESMEKIINERDVSKVKDSITQQLELGLEAFQFWKNSDDSKIEVYNILKEFRLSKYFTPLDKKNFATVGKFIELEKSTLFNAVTKDFELSEEEKVLMKKAISSLKNRIEEAKKKSGKDKSLDKSKDTKDTTNTPTDKALDVISKDGSTFTNEDIIDVQKSEIEKDLAELESDSDKIKLLAKEHDSILQRNIHLDKLLKQTQHTLRKQKSHNIEIDELMQTNIDDIFRKYQQEHHKNIRHAEELFEMITTMKNIYTTKRNKLLLSRNRQLKKSLDEAYQIIQDNEDKTMSAKLNHKQKHFDKLQRKRTKKKLKLRNPHTESSIPVYRVKTPKKYS
jgi:hypothetical protein